MATQFVNQVNFSIPYGEHKVEAKPFPELSKNALLVPDLIPATERQALMASLKDVNWQPVSVTGMGGNYSDGDEIGSHRASNYSPDYAGALWSRIKSFFPAVRVFSASDPTDWDEHALWQPFAVSSLLRFIRYEDNGWLVAHYDSPYIESEDVRTLSSLVIYLDKDPKVTGGATRFLFDPEPGKTVAERDLKDWDRAATENEVRLHLTPAAGTGVVFDHRLFHDAEKVKGSGYKTIVRTDILYKKVTS